MFRPLSPPRLNLPGTAAPAFIALTAGGLATGGRNPLNAKENPTGSESTETVLSEPLATYARVASTLTAIPYGPAPEPRSLLAVTVLLAVSITSTALMPLLQT
jgi:hypothetical protein